jgi:acyl dehydratase
MFARAIGDENPVYHDAEKSKDTEVGGIIAPPTFTASAAQFNPDGSRPRLGEKWFGSGKGPTGIEGKAPSAGGLNAEQHFEYFRPVRPGEVFTAETRPGKTWERKSKTRRQVVVLRSHHRLSRSEWRTRRLCPERQRQDRTAGGSALSGHG